EGEKTTLMPGFASSKAGMSCCCQMARSSLRQLSMVSVTSCAAAAAIEPSTVDAVSIAVKDRPLMSFSLSAPGALMFPSSVAVADRDHSRFFILSTTGGRRRWPGRAGPAISMLAPKRWVHFAPDVMPIDTTGRIHVNNIFGCFSSMNIPLHNQSVDPSARYTALSGWALIGMKVAYMIVETEA